MRKYFFVLIFCVSTSLFSQESQTNQSIEQSRIAPQAPKQKDLFKMFNMYIEYASGELNADPNNRILENYEVKLNYLQNIPKANWLSFGFVAKANFNDSFWNEKRYPHGKPGVLTVQSTLPSQWSIGASVGFFNIFSITVNSTGTLEAILFYNLRLPSSKSFFSHDFTLLLNNSFYLRGNQYTATGGILMQGWYENMELRLAYRMKFGKYFGIRPEVLFNISGTSVVARNKVKNAFLFRFNPRFQFYVHEWTFFIEPRFFYSEAFKVVGTNPHGFAWEIKIGIDLTKFWLSK